MLLEKRQYFIIVNTYLNSGTNAIPNNSFHHGIKSIKPYRFLQFFHTKVSKSFSFDLMDLMQKLSYLKVNLRTLLICHVLFCHMTALPRKLLHNKVLTGT